MQEAKNAKLEAFDAERRLIDNLKILFLFPRDERRARGGMTLTKRNLMTRSRLPIAKAIWRELGVSSLQARA